MDNTFIHENLIPRLTFNPELALTGFQTTRPIPLANLFISRRILSTTGKFASTIASRETQAYSAVTGNLGEREMLWEYKKQALHVFYFLRKHCGEEKENNLLTLIIKM